MTTSSVIGPIITSLNSFAPRGVGVYAFLGIVALSLLHKKAVGSPVEPQLRLWISKSCPYAARVWVTVLEKGIACDLKIIDLQNKPEEFNALYASLNVDPTASSKVPILEDPDGTKLIESAVIAQYIEDKFPLAGTYCMPSSAKDKAIVRLFIETFGVLQSMPYKCIATTPATRDELLESLRKAMKIVDKFLLQYGDKHGPFMFGTDFTFAEIMTGPFIQRLLPIASHFCNVDVLAECKTAGCARLLVWIEATLARKSMVTAKVPDDVLVASYEAAKARLSSMNQRN
jgi:glutathione S-transferase